MAKYQQYEEYKKSGIEWVGEIPAHWEETPVFSCFDATTEKNLDGKESNVLSLSYGNIIKRDVDTNFGLLPESFNTYQIVGVGDIILRLTDLQNDKKSLRVGLAKEKGIITSAYLKLKPKERLDSGFAYRLLHSYDTTKVYYGLGGGLRQSMKFEDFRRLPILVPPYEEQVKIANFLDHETAQIDTLIDKQQALIQLLKEKRQAVISHAVTKGLNPNAPMKDSGVEWLGEVPEHWEVRKLKYVCDLITKKTEIHNQYVIALENIESWTGNFVSSDSNYSGQDVGFDTGDILFSKLRPYLAKVYLAQAEGVAFGDLLVYRPKKELLNKYGFYLMTNEGFINTVNSSTYGSKMPRASTEFISEMPVVIPLLQEQKQIVAYVDKILARFDSLVLKAETAIQLMQERRTALISAAVTGKIDVRGWQAPDNKAS